MSRRSWIKLLTAWLVYAFLHLGIAWAPEPVVLLLGCPFESLFHHMKMAFFSYTLVSLVEVAWVPALRRPGPLAARGIGAVLYSYLALMLWLPVPVLFGMLHPVGLEVAYSSVTLAISLWAVVAVEARLERVEGARDFLAASTIVYAVSLLLFCVMPFREPPLDVFEDPAIHHHGEE